MSKIMSGPFHPGEIAMQQQLGVAERMAEVGPIAIRQQMPDQHRAFFATQRTIMVGAIDRTGRPWATMLFGEPGFVLSPNAGLLRIDAVPTTDDPTTAGLQEGSPVGLLGLDLATRRRNRVNGRIEAIDDTGFSVTVDQSFGNCPKYIAQREILGRHGLNDATPPAEPRFALDAQDLAIIQAADTAFIASSHLGEGDWNAKGVDVSHRGGAPGFLSLVGPRRIRFSDYPGNRYFNTLGNILLTPGAGLLIPDFTGGALLHLTGTAKISWGAELDRRTVEFVIAEAVRRDHAIPWQFSPPEAAPQIAVLKELGL